MNPFEHNTHSPVASDGANQKGERFPMAVEMGFEAARIVMCGERGPHIAEVQEKLAGQGFLKPPISNTFDEQMTRAVMAFQIAAGIDADGKIGKETQLRLLGRTLPPRVFDLAHPLCESQNFEIFGDFRIVGWWIANLVFLDLSVLDLYFAHVTGLSQGDKLGFYCHHLVAHHFKRAFVALADNGLHKKIVEYDGCFKVRYKRTRDGRGGDKDWSNHCWGIAIDINPSFSPLGRPLGTHPLQIDHEIAACFEGAGFFWGGRYVEDVIDTMHFQFCLPSRGCDRPVLK